MKTCRKCLLPLPPKAFYAQRSAKDGLQSYCKDCARSDQTKRYREAPEKQRAKSREYGRAHKAEAVKRAANWNLANGHRHAKAYRARKAGAFVELVDLAVVLERDSGLCALCSAPVDMQAKAPDANSPSLDHIVPLSRGGEHSYANIQLAHLGCNVRKGNRVEVA